MSRLLLVGLLGWAATFALSTPGNPVVDLTLRRHQLTGMLVSHLSVAAVIAATHGAGKPRVSGGCIAWRAAPASR